MKSFKVVSARFQKKFFFSKDFQTKKYLVQQKKE